MNKFILQCFVVVGMGIGMITMSSHAMPKKSPVKTTKTTKKSPHKKFIEKNIKDLLALQRIEQEVAYGEALSKMLDKLNKPKEASKDSSWFKKTIKATSAFTKTWYPMIAPYLFAERLITLVGNNLAHKVGLAQHAYTPLEVLMAPQIILPVIVMSLNVD